MDPNYEEELELITFTTMPQLLTRSKDLPSKLSTLEWFYTQVKDILTRGHSNESEN